MPSSLAILICLTVVNLALLLVNSAAVSGSCQGGLPLRIGKWWSASAATNEMELANLMASGVTGFGSNDKNVLGCDRKPTIHGRPASPLRPVRHSPVGPNRQRKGAGGQDRQVAHGIGGPHGCDTGTAIQGFSMLVVSKIATKLAMMHWRYKFGDMAMQGLLQGGIRQMPLATGDRFDSNRHRAYERRSGSLPLGSVLQVVQRGFVSTFTEVVDVQQLSWCAPDPASSSTSSVPPSESVQPALPGRIHRETGN